MKQDTLTTRDMTKNEAVIALNNGEKLTHRYFQSAEWIKKLDNRYYIFEDGIEYRIDEFWKEKSEQHWLTGWSIFETKKEEAPKTFLQEDHMVWFLGLSSDEITHYKLTSPTNDIKELYLLENNKKETPPPVKEHTGDILEVKYDNDDFGQWYSVGAAKVWFPYTKSSVMEGVKDDNEAKEFATLIASAPQLALRVKELEKQREDLITDKFSIAEKVVELEVINRELVVHLKRMIPLAEVAELYPQEEIWIEEAKAAITKATDK